MTLWRSVPCPPRSLCATFLSMVPELLYVWVLCLFWNGVIFWWLRPNSRTRFGAKKNSSSHLRLGETTVKINSKSRPPKTQDRVTVPRRHTRKDNAKSDAKNFTKRRVLDDCVTTMDLEPGTRKSSRSNSATFISNNSP